MKVALQRSIWLGFIVILAACGTLPVEQTATPWLTPLPTFTSPASSPIPFPTLPKSPISTAQPIYTLLPAVLPKFPLDGYVLLFTKDEDLYFQDGEKTPVKLTHVGEPIHRPYYFPRLSDDNKKVVFYKSDDKIYSINTDGTQEKVVIPSNWPDFFEKEIKKGSLQFLPNTHLLFFVTSSCGAQAANLPCSASAFLANIDTGKLRKLADLGLAIFSSNTDSALRNIALSPDGTMLAVGTTNGVDVLKISGELIRKSILPYRSATSAIIYPSLFWLPDSRSLIIALPNTIYSTRACDKLAAHTIWRYTLDSDSFLQIPLDPAPMMDTFEVSPDGTWIAYGGYCQPFLYLGNLVNGQTQIFGEDDSHPSFSWNADSNRLIIGMSTVFIALGKPPVIITGEGARWIDADHFISNQERLLLAEIKDANLSYYELGFKYPDLVAIKQRP